MSTQLSTRELFGGAMQMDLPTEYGDASDLRQIPDNQEVFLSPDSDTSLVVEVLGLVEEGEAGGDLWAAAKFHFASIAHDNASISTDIVTPPPTSPLHSAPSGSTTTPPGVILCGTQKIHKFSYDPTGAPRRGHEDDVADTVYICLALFRVWLEPGLSGEAPQGSSGESNGDLAAGIYSGGRKKADVVVSVNINLSSSDGKGEEEREKVQAWWESLVGSVKILDFGLFGDSD